MLLEQESECFLLVCLSLNAWLLPPEKKLRETRATAEYLTAPAVIVYFYVLLCIFFSFFAYDQTLPVSTYPELLTSDDILHLIKTAIVIKLLQFHLVVLILLILPFYKCFSVYYYHSSIEFFSTIGQKVLTVEGVSITAALTVFSATHFYVTVIIRICYYLHG